MAGYDLKDYVQVNERITAFKERFPDGSLQSEIIRLDEGIVVMKAYAYRTPDDPRPGVGHSSLTIPGSTPYTRGSELENCETSAFGRALAALGFEVKRGVASRDEVENKSGQSEGARSTRAVAAAAPAPARQRLAEAMARHNVSVAALERLSDSIGLERGKRATDEEIERLISLIEHQEDNVALEHYGPPESLPLPGLTEEEFEQVEAAVEATIPPKPGSEEYKGLTSFARSDARAYWQKQEVEA